MPDPEILGGHTDFLKESFQSSNSDNTDFKIVSGQNWYR